MDDAAKLYAAIGGMQSTDWRPGLTVVHAVLIAMESATRRTSATWSSSLDIGAAIGAAREVHGLCTALPPKPLPDVPELAAFGSQGLAAMRKVCPEVLSRSIVVLILYESSTRWHISMANMPTGPAEELVVMLEGFIEEAGARVQ